MGAVGRTLLWILVIALVAAAAAMVWQHLRYLDARRTVLHDRQEVFHSSDALHVVTFLRVAPATELFGAMRALHAATDAFPGARTVYAGKVAMNALSSSQLTEAFGEEVAWDAVTLAQFDDRSVYDAYRGNAAVQTALAEFGAIYAHGMKRSALGNLMLPQALLASRVAQAVSFQPSAVPFEPATAGPLAETLRELRARLLAERELGRDAILVANLLQGGTPEEVAANADYGSAMMGVMARGGHGPMHMGASVTLEGDATFDGVAFVYYPGVQYFHDLTGSTFFRGIVGDKQLGDTQATVTVPILHLL